MSHDEEPTKEAPPRPTARPSEADLRPGGRLGRYTLLEKVGAGGMGEVYAAWDGQLGRRVAIKLIHAQFRGEQSERARLVREARTLAQLQHPNVVSVYELGSAAGLDYVVMEYVEGRTLRHVLREDRPGPERVKALLTEAGRGLQAIHAAGLVHRDFKPTNVLVGNDGRVRLMDFGLARAAGAAVQEENVAGAPLSEDDSVTALGTSPGTPRYMPPEQMDGGAPDARTDQFAFAVAAWSILLGAPPFPDGSEPSVRRAAIRAGPPEAEARKLPRRLRTVLLRALAARPEDRFPDLAPLLHELSGDAGRERWKRRLAVLSVLAVFASAVAATWWNGRVERACAPAVLVARALPPGRAVAVQLKAREVLGAGSPEAEALKAELDEWFGGWAEASSAVCRAEFAGLSREVAGQRACLEGRRANAEGIVQLLEEGRKEVLEIGRAAVRSLPVVDGCARATPREALASVPEEERRAVRKALGSARAAFLAADARRTQAEADQALTLPALAVDPVLRAEARMLRTRAVEELDAPAAEVEAGYREALTLAISERDEGVEAEAWILYLGHLTQRPEDWPAARALMPVGCAAVWRTGEDTSKSGFLHMRAGFHQRTGRHAEGLSDAQEALVLAEARRPRSPKQVARMEMMVGILLSGMNRPEEAIVHDEKAVAAFEEIYPADHPMLASAVNNLANTWLKLDRPDKAVPLFERALAALVARRGIRHSITAAPLNNLAGLALREGRLDEAEERFRKAHAALVASLGPTHLRTGISVMGLAAVAAERGKFAEARGALEGLEKSRAVAGKRSEAVREVQVARALVELQDGKAGAAKGLLEQAAPPEGEEDLSERLVMRAVAAAVEGKLLPEVKARSGEAAAYLAKHPSLHDARTLEGLGAALEGKVLPERLPRTGVGGVVRRLNAR